VNLKNAPILLAIALPRAIANIAANTVTMPVTPLNWSAIVDTPGALKHWRPSVHRKSNSQRPFRDFLQEIVALMRLPHSH
jgi:hypothetical protein